MLHFQNVNERRIYDYLYVKKRQLYYECINRVVSLWNMLFMAKRVYPERRRGTAAKFIFEYEKLSNNFREDLNLFVTLCRKFVNF